MIRLIHILALWWLQAVCLWPQLLAQPYSPGSVFYQLTTAQGLSDNYIRSLAIDRTGLLWVGTGEGLNCFDGRKVTRYFARLHPGLVYDYINQLACDSQNRVWALTALGHVTLVNNRRQLKHIGFYQHGKFEPAHRLAPTEKFGVLLVTRSGFYRLRQTATASPASDSLSATDFEKLEIANLPSLDTLTRSNFKQVGPNQYSLTRAGSFWVIDFENGSTTAPKALGRQQILCGWDERHALTFNTVLNRLELLSLETGLTEALTPEGNNSSPNGFRGKAQHAIAAGQEHIAISTQADGLFLLRKKDRRFFSFTHDAANAASLANNRPLEMAADENGWLFAGCTPHGVSYFNYKAVVGHKMLFTDRQGTEYNGYISNITSFDHQNLYLATSDYLVEWNRNTDESRFLRYCGNFAPLREKPVEVSHVAAIGPKTLWVATAGEGIFVYEPATGKSTRLPFISAALSMDSTGFVNHITEGPDGSVWVSCRKGLFMVNGKTLRLQPADFAFRQHLRRVHCIRTWFDADGNAWIATAGKGVVKREAESGRFVIYNTATGLPSNNVYAVLSDRAGNLYFGTEEGLHIHKKNGTIRHIKTEDGLLNKRVEALVMDGSGRLWLGNDVGLACYNPANDSLKVFDERYGLSIQGFRVNSYATGSQYLQYWGTERGLQFFNPEMLYPQEVKVQALVNGVESRSIATSLTGDEVLPLNAGDNYVNFSFNTIEYSPNLRVHFRYRLEGIDTSWIQVTDAFSARYTLLPPGRYAFRLQVSNDARHWFDARNTVTIRVPRPWYLHPATIGAGALCILLLTVAALQAYRRRHHKKQEELKSGAVINYFASQINSHLNEEDILWDVARNCISQLQFEDCVIYLLDTERQVLVQKAAYGPKSSITHTILQPIEIPVGKGIVGTVAQTGKPLLISNTQADPRYITDDQQRMSELAVPLIVAGKVTGVIDSEHAQKNFFTANHLRILSTIAVLTANQILRARAEAEKQQAQLETLLNRQQAAEYRLQSLRLQMNPHFLFNALNSIQQMILANEELVATRYLSRFSKLLRAVLIHSEEELVTLQQEIDILKLYIDLEAVRFKDSFSYTLQCDKAIDTEEVRIPTLLVQPFVENAIWHGLMHKDGDKRLHIHFSEKGSMVVCTVEDNGVGRTMTAKAKTNGSPKGHTSKGIQVSTERLKKMELTHGEPGRLEIEDLFDADGSPAGTRVHIAFPN